MEVSCRGASLPGNMDTEAELARLRQTILKLETEQIESRHQLSRLQQQVDEITGFFKITRPKQPGEAPVASLHCSGVYLLDPEDPKRLRAFFLAGLEGPCISILGEDEQARVTLSVGKDGARVKLSAKGAKPAVELWCEEETGRGQVVVYEAGKPRALMKASKEGGIVGVVHDDGHSRAFMISSQTEGGEIMTVTPDMKAGVKISAASPHGGFIAVNRTNGKAGVLIACTPLSGAVVVNDAKGKLLASLPPVAPGGATAG